MIVISSSHLHALLLVGLDHVHDGDRLGDVGVEGEELQDGVQEVGDRVAGGVHVLAVVGLGYGPVGKDRDEIIWCKT